MSRVWRSPLAERAGIVVLVAGAHLATFTLLSKTSSAQRNLHGGGELIFVELDPVPVAPAPRLPELDRRLELPEEAPPLLTGQAPLPAPNTFPSPVRRAPAGDLMDTASARESRSVVSIDPDAPSPAASGELTLAAQTALRGIVCNRLSSDRAARCDDDAGEGEDSLWRAASLSGPAEIAAAMAASGEAFPVDGGALYGSPLAILASLQGDLDRDNPYRSGATLDVAGKTGQHVIPASAPGSQASRDMGLRAMAAPHPVWGD